MNPVHKKYLRFLLNLGAVFGIFLNQAMAQNTHQDVRNHVYFRNFWTPLVHGLPLAFCSSNGTGCGKSVAQAYCRAMGYQSADHWTRAYHLPQTRYLDNDRHCTQHECDGFKTIRCVGRLSMYRQVLYPYRKMRFMFPRFNGYRVDWCYDGQPSNASKKSCGRRAAQSFCVRLGYMKTIGFRPQAHLGETQAIGNQKRCDHLRCQGFHHIDCYR